MNDYPLEYGYLVYWYYDYDNEQNPYIHKVATKKIMLDTFALKLFNKTLTIHETRFAIGETLAHLEYLRLNGKSTRELQENVYVYRAI